MFSWWGTNVIVVMRIHCILIRFIKINEYTFRGGSGSRMKSVFASSLSRSILLKIRLWCQENNTVIYFFQAECNKKYAIPQQRLCNSSTNTMQFLNEQQTIPQRTLYSSATNTMQFRYKHYAIPQRSANNSATNTIQFCNKHYAIPQRTLCSSATNTM